MQVIGRLHVKSEKTGTCFEGHFSVVNCTICLALVPAEQSANPNAPNFLILARNPVGHLDRIGAAWVKTMKRGDRAGEKFLSITLGDPSLPKSLNVAAFKNLATDAWDIGFRRRQSGGFMRTTATTLSRDTV